MIAKILCFISGILWAVGWYSIIPEPSMAFNASITMMLLAAIVD